MMRISRVLRNVLFSSLPVGVQLQSGATLSLSVLNRFKIGSHRPLRLVLGLKVGILPTIVAASVKVLMV